MAATWEPKTAEEVNTAKSFWSNFAPGPDGISVNQVLRVDDNILACVYNCITLSGLIPTGLRIARTVLVQKSGPKMRIDKWRPITIGSEIHRLHHRTIDRRLRPNMTLNCNQRGFTEADDTLANIMIIDTFIRTRKPKNKTMAIALLNVAKAFDTNSHDAISHALTLKGVDEFRLYIM